MTIVGLFIGGVSNIIAGTISADLGRQDAIQGNSEALAIVTGPGSFGVALGQIIVPVIHSHFNWFYEFYYFIACVCLNKILYLDRPIIDCFYFVIFKFKCCLKTEI